jgi:hypothetical protein
MTFILVLLVVNLAWTLYTQLAQSPDIEFRRNPLFYTILSALATVFIALYLVGRVVLRGGRR